MIVVVRVNGLGCAPAGPARAGLGRTAAQSRPGQGGSASTTPGRDQDARCRRTRRAASGPQSRRPAWRRAGLGGAVHVAARHQPGHVPAAEPDAARVRAAARRRVRTRRRRRAASVHTVRTVGLCGAVSTPAAAGTAGAGEKAGPGAVTGWPRPGRPPHLCVFEQPEGAAVSSRMRG